jgi:hypothetical protein
VTRCIAAAVLLDDLGSRTCPRGEKIRNQLSPKIRSLRNADL